MRAVILADASFATRERAMLSRVEVGLVGEGVRVVHAIPESARVAHASTGLASGELFAQALSYNDRGPALTRPWRARKLVEAIERRKEGGDERSTDIVHAVGYEAWPMGLELAAQTGCPIAIEVWRAAMVPAAARLRGAVQTDLGPTSPLFLVPDKALERLLRTELERSGPGSEGVVVRVTPWGVHTPAKAHEVLSPGKSVSVVVIGSGSDRAGFEAALAGLAEVVKRGVEMMIFVDSEASQKAGAWAIAKSLGLTEQFTLVPELEARRELTLCSDILVLPEAIGEYRSLTLDAMAAGVVVVAAPDAMVGCLIDGRTARLVERAQADRWSAVLSGVMEDPVQSRALAESAREYVRQSHRASAHVAAVVDAYEWMVSRDALPFR